jgi:hypothetical protein
MYELNQDDYPLVHYRNKQRTPIPISYHQTLKKVIKSYPEFTLLQLRAAETDSFRPKAQLRTSKFCAIIRLPKVICYANFIFLAVAHNKVNIL